ncbi:2-dehydropantoate 2-reductase [Litorimonas sp. RW-G-Af-16]|uniref:2-dehydropantoate 2-reductase n=1 Tax=Litorimonas sp. RW-G-Af-16 TaxID=3241168 RepID=UPI00390CD582
MTDHPHIVILGAGSIGCYLGGLLQHGGSARVTFIGRERYQTAIANHGLTLTHFSRDPIHLDQVDFQIDYVALATADIILLCTKSQDTEDAANIIKTHAKADVQVISFQNGIRNPETLRQGLPKAKIIPAIVPFNVTPAGAGAFHCGTEGALVVGAGVDNAVLEAFTAAGQPIKVEDNILAAQWAKMAVNLNNALNTLAGGTLREGLLQRDYRRALALIVEEALVVAKANGVTPSTFNGRRPEQLIATLRLPNWAYKILMQLIVKIDAKARSSMQDDLDAARVSEIDYLQGEIVRHAAFVGIEAPYNAAVLRMTQAAFAKGQSPKMTGTEILSAISK